MKSADTLHPSEILPAIKRYMIGDGFPLVFDLEKSHGSWIHDALSGKEYLDFYTFFASLPVGFHHPRFHEERNLEALQRTALHKPANSDAYTRELARFTRHFAESAMPPPFRHLFFIEGGALAVENALKAAFDWKVRRNLAAGRGEIGTRVLHFREAFHGRSGYTLSLTNTLPVKTNYFPKFDWPRVTNPKVRFPQDDAETARVEAEEARAIEEIDRAFERRPHEIAAIIIEPIQGEGGDNHFRPEFLRALRRIADAKDALLIFDEIQTGFGITGRMWAYEHFDCVPDIVCFGKKSQVCGIMAGPRIDSVQENVFTVPSRINSTWGGSLADMCRCEIILEIIKEENLLENSSGNGAALLRGLEDLARRFARLVSNPRGRGLMCAFDCPDTASRNRLLDKTRAHLLLVLPCGERSVRFRPPLNVRPEEIDEALRRLTAGLEEV